TRSFLPTGLKLQTWARLLTFVSLALVPYESSAADIEACKLHKNAFGPSFMSAAHFREQNEDVQIGYVMGFFEGMATGSVFGASTECLEALYICVKDVSSSQLTAIVNKYVEANPEGWHLPMTIIAFNAIGRFCGVPGRKK
ncbi:hypothetical protein, partial [Actibacterium sp.]|uniref:hypothetical protein n=1 Tax=Actibacterium sp. TaxID=1872125 RepID=UPI0035669FAF